MQIRNKIYINLDEERIDPKILELLTYDNPDYHMKKNLGLPVFGIPKVICTYGITGRTMEIARGEALRVKDFLSHCRYEFDHPDHPVTLRYLNSDFDLDEYQEGAIKAMKATRQGIVHALTSAGKSLMIVKAIAELGQRAIIVVHRKVLMKQILEDIEKYIRDEKGNKIVVGIIGDGKNTVGDITVAIDKSLARNLAEHREGFGVCILDECHLAPAATIFDTLNEINAMRRYGFSGTLKRKDQKEFLIFSTFGSVIYTIGKEELLEKKRIVPVALEILETETRFDWDAVVEGLIDQGHKNPTVKARDLQNKTIALDSVRRMIAVDKAAELFRAGHKVIILSNYVEPCYGMRDMLKSVYGIDAGVITGTDSKEADESYTAMKHGSEMKVVFATVGCVSTGLSISDLDDIILTSPILTNELLLHQIRGRLMRTFKGKTHGTLWMLWDQHIFEDRKLRKFKNIIAN